MSSEVITPNPSLLCDIAGELLAQEAVAREAVATGKAPGPVTGIKPLDDEIGGFMSRGLHILLAAPGAGKTALALQIAGNCRCPALYVTSEMPRVELLRRIIARTTGTYLGKLRGGKMSADELTAHITQAARACPMMALYDATDAPATSADIQQKAELLRTRFDASHVLIIVDSVTDWALSAAHSVGAGSSGNDERTVAELALKSLKAITNNVPCAVLGIAHRNRGGQNSKGSDRLHAAKGSGYYEYVTDGVWDLDRDTGQEPDDKHRTTAELTILKNRFGSTGVSFDLEFEGRLQRFSEA
jgi:replicative DNA helicase